MMHDRKLHQDDKPVSEDRVEARRAALERLYFAAIGSSVYPSPEWSEAATQDYHTLRAALSRLNPEEDDK